MAPPQRRRDVRYRLHVPLVVRYGGRSRNVTTEDVSFRGLFMRTDDPPQLRELIRIDARLPPHETAFSSQAMTVWASRPGESPTHVPGAGIQFYAMGSERTKWEAFVAHARKTGTPVAEEPAASPADPVRRRHQRIPLRLAVRPRSIQELITMYSRDVSAGGMFLATDRRFDLDSVLQLDIRHPQSDKVFSLSASVRRAVSEPVAGIGVEFVEVDDVQRQRFYEFIHSDIAEIEDVDLVDADDPNLE